MRWSRVCNGDWMRDVAVMCRCETERLVGARLLPSGSRSLTRRCRWMSEGWTLLEDGRAAAGSWSCCHGYCTAVAFVNGAGMEVLLTVVSGEKKMVRCSSWCRSRWWWRGGAVAAGSRRSGRRLEQWCSADETVNGDGVANRCRDVGWRWWKLAGCRCVVRTAGGAGGSQWSENLLPARVAAAMVMEGEEKIRLGFHVRDVRDGRDDDVV